MRAGGRIALLDDFGKGAGFLGALPDPPHPCAAPPARAPCGTTRATPSLPRAVQQVAGHEEGRHPVVADVSLLVTNHPSALTHPNLTPVLDIAAVGEPNATLAVTGVIAGKGRLFAMGDPSAVINLMMRYPGNRAFADGLVGYLVEEDTWGHRGGKLYLVSGRFRQHGTFGGAKGLQGELLEHLSGLSDAIDQIHDDGLPELLAILLGSLAALGGVAWTLLTASRTYRRATPRYASPQPLVGQGGVAGRAAVLGAPSTHRALAVLELKSALEEGLLFRLGLPGGASSDRILEEIHRQNALSQPSSEQLSRILAEMKTVEMAVLAGQPIRVSRPQVERKRDDVLRLLREVDEALGRAP